jgi:hypothetical protein
MFLLAGLRVRLQYVFTCRCKSTTTVCFYLQGVRVHMQYVSTYKV